MNLTVSKKTLQNFYQSSKIEWLETNGMGGWASSSINGSNSRKYHGLLVASANQPHGRYVMLSKLDEKILTPKGEFALHTNKYRETIFPNGYQHLKSFRKNLFPEFIYEVEGIKLKKTIAAPQGEQTTLLIYEVMEADHDFEMELTPLLAAREYHQTAQANGAINHKGHFSNGTLQYKPYDALPEVYISIPGSEYLARPDWYHHFEYLQDKERGEHCHEDLFSPGVFRITLHQGDQLGIILSTENTHFKNVFNLYEKERARRQSLLTDNPFKDDFYWQLLLASDQFLVKRKDGQPAILSGYHWFTERSRDALIALPGLCLATNRLEDARQILSSYAGRLHEGLLPGRYADDGLDSDFSSVDAPLWFFHAVEHYYQKTNDWAFVKNECLPTLKNIIQNYEQGTLYNIKMDKDKLLSAGDSHLSLTWMDAGFNYQPHSPRPGKAVEVNALWYNAIRIYENFLMESGNQRDALRMESLAAQIRKSFKQAFWNAEEKCLYDYIDGHYQDRKLRPNQLLAIGLSYPVLEGQKALGVLEKVKKHLLTPAGIRSLARESEGYSPSYSGNEAERSYAYHHGVIWHWIFGFYVDACMRLHGKSDQPHLNAVLTYLRKQLLEAGIGTISEICEAERPYHAKGCIARAISVSEILRIGDKYEFFEKEDALNEMTRNSDVHVKGESIPENEVKSNSGESDYRRQELSFSNPFSMISAFRSPNSGRIRWLRPDFA